MVSFYVCVLAVLFLFHSKTYGKKGCLSYEANRKGKIAGGRQNISFFVVSLGRTENLRVVVTPQRYLGNGLQERCLEPQESSLAQISPQWLPFIEQVLCARLTTCIMLFNPFNSSAKNRSCCDPHYTTEETDER